MNRLLGLPVARQNLLFSYFEATLGAEIRAAKVRTRRSIASPVDEPLNPVPRRTLRHANLSPTHTHSGVSSDERRTLLWNFESVPRVISM